VDSGEQKTVIEGRRDLAGGRIAGSLQSDKSADASKCFTSITYTADGNYILAGGRTKFACVYSVRNGSLIKKFQLSHNKSLEGIVDEMNSRSMTDGINVETLQGGNLRGAGVARDQSTEFLAANVLPGTGGTRDGGQRNVRPELITHGIRFSPSGRDWAAATTQGLQLFSVDPTLLFVPIDLDMAVTPQAVTQALATEQYPMALTMALQLGEGEIIRTAVGATPLEAVPIVVRSLDTRLLVDFMRFLADEVVSSRHVEFFLSWVQALLNYFGQFLQGDPVPYQASLRALVRAVGVIEKDIQRAVDDNHYMLQFLQTQSDFLAKEAETTTTKAVEDDNNNGTEIALMPESENSNASSQESESEEQEVVVVVPSPKVTRASKRTRK
jgi:periodic tryptophan protein 2